MFPLSQNKKELSKKLIEQKLISNIKDDRNYIGDEIDHNERLNNSLTLKKESQPSLLVTNQINNKEVQQNVEEPEVFMQKSTYYNYRIKDVLSSQDILKTNLENTVFICCYTINTSGLKPFIQYLLYLDYNTSEENSLFYFPFIESKKGTTIKKQVSDYIDSLTDDTLDYNLHGSLMNKGNMCVFVEIQNMENNNSIFGEEKIFDVRENKLLFCSLDEIINSAKVFNLIIHNSVSSILTSHPEILFLYNKSSKSPKICLNRSISSKLFLFNRSLI